MLSETSQLKEDRYYKIPLTGGTWSSPGFPGGSDGKQSACNAGDPGSIPRSGGSPREGNGNPLQYSCLGNPMDRGAWRATVHGVATVGHDLVAKQQYSSVWIYQFCLSTDIQVTSTFWLL